MDLRSLQAFGVEEECHEADADVQKLSWDLVLVDESFPFSVDWNQA